MKNEAMNIKELRELTKLTQEGFCKKYEIPQRTLQHWEAGTREPAPYIVALLRKQVLRDYSPNKLAVLTAIARQMEFFYSKVLSNPINEGKDLSSIVAEVNKLYDAYMELRGHKGSAINIDGVDQEVNNVKSIYDLVNK